jgi:NitT/TauT family transport system ATP-binding protein
MPHTPPAVDLDSITRRFARRGGNAPLVAIERVSFSVAPGSFVAVVGPSGCGKSTLLNLVAGLDPPDEGTVRVGGAVVAGPNPQVGFMLQKDLLLPWRTILRNVEFGLEGRPGIGRAERRARAERELARCGLSEFARHYPAQLSGGMRQRAALARTLAIAPDVILLDEPFSALDAITKLTLQQSFANTIHAAGVTALLITHDLTEAVAMADRVLVMSGRPGRIVEDITLDLPQRGNPMARRRDARAQDYVARLFSTLRLDAAEAA